MTDRPPEEKREETNGRSYRMRFGTDLKYHFEDPELRQKCGDSAEFQWIDTTFVESAFILDGFSG